MHQRYTTILLPTRPQVDTIIAVFILKTFGEAALPGVATAALDFSSRLNNGETEEHLAAHGTLLVDIGKGKFDHHAANLKTTAADLVAAYLGVESDPALQKLLAFARRDDFYGRGIVSTDPLDRAFGLSGLVVNLNKQWVDDPQKVVAITLPLIAAHYAEEVRRTQDVPREVEAKIAAGQTETFTVVRRDKKLKVISIETDNVSVPGYLRSQTGGRHDVVVQRSPTGHVNILTRPTKRINLQYLVALVRREEARRAGQTLIPPDRLLAVPGLIEEIPEWYYDPATNSLQNGGVNPAGIPPTKIPQTDWRRIIEAGLA